jgi:hypothetical protein
LPSDSLDDLQHFEEQDARPTVFNFIQKSFEAEENKDE